MTLTTPVPAQPPTIVWGFGSIGQRHARVLAELGCPVSVVTRQTITKFPRHGTIASALAATSARYCVIATPTAEHALNLAALAEAGFQGRVLVEKPLAATWQPLPPHRFSAVHVGYNLRFHPVIQAARERLGGRPAYAAAWRVGQYLPDWRPGTDYRRSYSASRAEGGGVLRDLSHEIDLALWFFGPWQQVVAMAGRIGPLELEAEDSASVLAECTRCPQLSIHLNYLDRMAVRQFTITAPDLTLVGDLIRSTLTCNGETVVLPCARDETYRRQHQAVLTGDQASLCALPEGEEAVRFIAAVERSASERQWIQRS